MTERHTRKRTRAKVRTNELEGEPNESESNFACAIVAEA